MVDQMKRAMVLLLNLLLLTRFEMAGAQEYRIAKENERGFQMLLDHLLSAYERPSAGDENRIAADLVRIRKEDEDDYEVARAIADHWRSVYLDGEYQLLLYHGEERAAVLMGTGIPDSETHAFVVLGYALRNGEMTEELKGRCDAAAAAARAFPKAILVCSGGATGGNNPENQDRKSVV